MENNQLMNIITVLLLALLGLNGLFQASLTLWRRNLKIGPERILLGWQAGLGALVYLTGGIVALTLAALLVRYSLG